MKNKRKITLTKKEQLVFSRKFKEIDSNFKKMTLMFITILGSIYKLSYNKNREQLDLKSDMFEKDLEKIENIWKQ